MMNSYCLPNRTLHFYKIYVFFKDGEEIFLTTKVWITSAGKTILSHNKSQIPVRTLKKLMRSIEANSGQIIEKWIEQFGEIRYYC